MILCETCICFPICINQVTFKVDKWNDFHYTMQFNGIHERCDYFDKAWDEIKNSDGTYREIKKFFLEQKGLL